MENNKQFADKNYWDQRFDLETEYEWFGLNFSDLLPILKKNIETFNDKENGSSKTVLMLGTGNSKLPVEMAEDYVCVTGLDFSDVALQRMQQRLSPAEQGHIEWLVTDLRQMPLRSNSYDIVFEKGTIDVFFVGEKDPWKPSPETVETVDKIMYKIWEILPVGGIFLSITFAQPHFRLPFFLRHNINWSVSWFIVRGKSSDFDYYCYVATKIDENCHRPDKNIEQVRRLLERPSLSNGAEKMQMAADRDESYLTKHLGDDLFS